VDGGKRGASIQDAKNGWLQGLRARAGIRPAVTKEDPTSFEWEVNQCAYGLCKPEESGIWHAVMDLDRTFTRLIGGEPTILDEIPDGAAKCKYTTRLRDRRSSKQDVLGAFIGKEKRHAHVAVSCLDVGARLLAQDSEEDEGQDHQRHY
jgi:hypothetical protein